VFSVESPGSFEKTTRFLHNLQKLDILGIMQSCGADGVHALASATPRDSGRAASSWYFEAKRSGSTYILAWYNNDLEDGFPVAIMLQYGYGTGTGGYVAGVDYINPAIRPIFDAIADKVWKAVKSA
jgi:hypothetical protein